MGEYDPLMAPLDYLMDVIGYGRAEAEQIMRQCQEYTADLRRALWLEGVGVQDGPRDDPAKEDTCGMA